MIMRPGTKRDAVRLAIAANQTHGLPRTNDDKRRAVKMAFEDEEMAQWSNHAIGDYLWGVP